jgi:hypothetical protein
VFIVTIECVLTTCKWNTRQMYQCFYLSPPGLRPPPLPCEPPDERSHQFAPPTPEITVGSALEHPAGLEPADSNYRMTTLG